MVWQCSYTRWLNGSQRSDGILQIVHLGKPSKLPVQLRNEREYSHVAVGAIYMDLTRWIPASIDELAYTERRSVWREILYANMDQEAILPNEWIVAQICSAPNQNEHLGILQVRLTIWRDEWELAFDG